MEQYFVWINLVSNIILTVGFSAFLIFLFGRDNSLVYRLSHFQIVLMKIGLCVCAAGSLLNALTLSNPPITEIVLNVGLAIVFGWATMFHYVRFVRSVPIATKAAPMRSKKISKK